jgi:nitric oxide reductase subunit C
MNHTPWWASVRVWGHIAAWVTAIMLVALAVLTWDTLRATAVGSQRVPAFSVINHHIDYVYSEAEGKMVPVIGTSGPLFGEELSEAQAEALVTHGKKLIQAKNCMNCHTLLGNGAYYAPDLTKAWLDPAWGNPGTRELLMVDFLRDPQTFARTFGTGRKMPPLDIDEQEARAIVAFLKWMSAIDTNGFPAQFRVLLMPEE